ncbi:flagellar basal body rod protein FlgB [Pseudaminobacter sp. 19-2017]|uniref:Flagellar basal body rod protein FlgB n=1 Tax=Pseudaminobacter soli (ex Zhang et al. 2022) TaxID=2831468 RepID=A0A942I3H1_9HYPH|nr:flagellar basal body rod protein FlgB [Pseudaminobacter soli]MBS3650328.1 flagellar basal body rod protein FlgB [Pseudaminobacter soli]
MQPVNLFMLATRQAEWLSARQTSVAGNIANANTPGYKAVDVEPFEKVLSRSVSTLAATHATHFGAKAGEVSFRNREDDRTTATLPSKNTVVLEQELIKAGEVRRSFEMNTAIVKAFHRMMLMSVKG